jgi:transcription antitermination factor NusG
MAKKPTKKKKIVLDFSEVKTRAAIPDGDYQVEVTDVEMKTASTGNDMLAVQFNITEGEYEGKTLYRNFVLTPQAMWVIMEFLQAAGWEIDGDEIELDEEDLIGLEVGATTTTEVYEGRPRSQIGSFFSLEEEEEEEEKPAPKSKKEKAAKTPEPTKKEKKSKKPKFAVGDKVTFTDEDGDDQTGKITEIDEDGDSVTVKVGKEEWELELSEISPA